MTIKSEFREAGLGSSIHTDYVDANGLRFEVDMCGDGERLALCLHGFPESAFSWRYQLPLLAELGYTAWAPNLRGYGGSTRPAKTQDYHIDHLVADVAGLIDAASKPSTVLIGHDWGGAIAWAFALRHVRPLERLVVMNLPHPRLFLRGLFRWPQIRRSWYIFFFQLPWLPEYLLGRNAAQRVARAFTETAVDPGRFGTEVTDVYREQALQPGALTAMVNYYRANFRRLPRGEDAKALEVRLETPTLMIWGEEDTALGKELTYGTEALVEDLTLEYLPGVSHWVQQEAPEQVNRILASWLTAKPGQA